jgi:hypothetical protein
VIALSSEKYAARVAGFAFLFLIATDLVSGLVAGGVRTTHGAADTLASIAENSTSVRVSLVLTFVGGIMTLVLAAALYGIVARQDRNLSIFALSCRAVEAGLYSVGILRALALLSLSQSYTNAEAGDAASIRVLTDLLVKLGPLSSNVGATFFAAGSTVYCYLLLTSRAIPVPLSVTGVVGSLLILVGVPVQTALSHNTFSGASALIWLPIAVFEISTGAWLLVRGVRVSTTQPAERIEAVV